MAKTAAERKREQRKRQSADGLVDFSDRVPRHAVAYLRVMCATWRTRPDLEMAGAPLRDPKTGRLVGVK